MTEYYVIIGGSCLLFIAVIIGLYEFEDVETD